MSRELVPKSPQSPKARKELRLSVAIPKKLLSRVAPDPGPQDLSIIDGLADELSGPIGADPFLQQMILRFGNLMAEGEGVTATEEYQEIDNYIAQVCIDYLRRQKVRRSRVRASCVLVGKQLNVHLVLYSRQLQTEVRRFMEIPL